VLTRDNWGLASFGPAAKNGVPRGILYLPYCTYYYIHITSAYETTEKGYEAWESCPDGGFRGRKRPAGPRPEWLGYYRPIKMAATLRLDADVLAWFQRQARGYQTRINRALRKLMSEERKISTE